MPSSPLTCSRCGATDSERPDGGSWAVEAGRSTWTCGPCIRRNIRAIEGKLPEEWWE